MGVNEKVWAGNEKTPGRGAEGLGACRRFPLQREPPGDENPEDGGGTLGKEMGTAGGCLWPMGVC